MVGGVKVVKHRKSRTKKLIQAVENTQPITEKALAASGITAARKPRRVRVKKVGGNFDDVMRTVGDVVSSGYNSGPRCTFAIRLRQGEKANRMEYISSQSKKRKRIKLKET